VGDSPFPSLNGAYGLITGNGTLGDINADYCAANWTCPAVFAAPPNAVTLTFNGGAWATDGPASGVGRGDAQPVAGINTNTALSAQVWASDSAAFVPDDTVPLCWASPLAAGSDEEIFVNTTLVPQRRDAPLVAVKTGDVLTLDGEAFDYGPMQEGDVLPAIAIASDLFARLCCAKKVRATPPLSQDGLNQWAV
jgi:hypothetical protein